MLHSPIKTYGKLGRANVLTQTKMQFHSDSRTKQKEMLGEKIITWLVHTYLVLRICLISGEDHNGRRYFLGHKWGSANYEQRSFVFLCTRESKNPKNISLVRAPSLLFHTQQVQTLPEVIQGHVMSKSLLGSLADASSQTQQLTPTLSYKFPQELQCPHVPASVQASIQCYF